MEQPGHAGKHKLRIGLYGVSRIHGMKRGMQRLPEQMLRDDAELRAFFESVGIRMSITEAAIKVRRNRPTIEQDNELPARDKPRK